MRPFDLRYGTVPIRWCHGVTLKFFVLNIWPKNDMLLTVLMTIRMTILTTVEMVDLTIWQRNEFSRYWRNDDTGLQQLYEQFHWKSGLANNTPEGTMIFADDPDALRTCGAANATKQAPRYHPRQEEPTVRKTKSHLKQRLRCRALQYHRSGKSTRVVVLHGRSKIQLGVNANHKGGDKVLPCANGTLTRDSC
ncbi:hypothetical protein GEV33_004637 [Tenebrio molitor]|uniref:Uncharacterized protein n=1 Tax=Tenebrio molitor TaxID=7067 RepID=A0A8J6LD92_TENMO|nr:hypothetical protein GEV33_004637 [Tenebrio molitor]